MHHELDLHARTLHTLSHLLFTVPYKVNIIIILFTDEETEKLWCIYTVEYYSTIKKNKILPSWMDLEGIMLSEISQTEKDKYCMISLIMESKKYSQLMNRTKKKETHRYKEQTSGYQRGKRGEG